MASKPLQIAVDAAELFWTQLQSDFDVFWSTVWGTLTDTLRKIITFDLDANLGLTTGLIALGIDALSSIIDAASTFLSALSVGPFLSVAQSALAHFDAPALKGRVVTLDKAVQAVGLLILDRGRNAVLNPGSTLLGILSVSMNTAGWQKKLVDILTGRFGNVLVARFKALVRSVVFFVLNSVVILGQVGFAAGMMLVVLTLQDDAQKRPDLLALPALPQSNKRRPRKRRGWTRERVSQ